MRDTDVGWMTKIVAVTGGSVSCLADLKGRTLALGSRDSGHAAILPVYFLVREGMAEGKDYRSLRFNSDVGKHGDTGASEVDVVRAVLDGRADAGAIGSPFWNTVRTERLVPEGALTEIWTSRPYNHCMFTARSDLDPALEQAFAKALFGMSYDNPMHRPVLEAEGLRQWLAPQLEAYAELREASAQQGFFGAPLGLAARSQNWFGPKCTLRHLSGAIKNLGQPALMLMLAIEGVPHSCEGIGQGKDFAADQ